MSRSSLILLLIFCLISISAANLYAVELVSAKAASQADGRTLLVLTFNTKADARLMNESGDLVEIQVPGLTKSSPKVTAGGLVSGVLVESGKITVLTNTFVQGTILPAGSGLFVLTLKKTSKFLAGIEKDTKETVKKRTSSVFYEGEYEDVEVDEDQPVEDNQSDFYDTRDHGISWGSPTVQARKIPVSELPKDIQKAYEEYLDGDLEKALKILGKIKQNEEGYGWARVFMGNIYIEQGKARRALDHYHQAMKTRETRELATVKLALEFQRTGNRDAAMTMWEKVLSIVDGRLVLPPVEIEEIPVMAKNTDDEPEEEKTEKEAKESKGGLPLPLIFGGIFLIVGALIGLKFMRDRKLNKALSDLEDEDYDFDDVPPPKKVINLYDDNDEDEPPSEDDAGDIPWGGEEADDSDSAPAFDEAFDSFDDEPAEEIDDSPPEAPEPKAAPESSGDENLQGPKLRKIEALHKQGATVREIAETLGIGQDEVRMVIRLVNDEEEI